MGMSMSLVSLCRVLTLILVSVWKAMSFLLMVKVDCARLGNLKVFSATKRFIMFATRLYYKC